MRRSAIFFLAVLCALGCQSPDSSGGAAENAAEADAAATGGSGGGKTSTGKVVPSSAIKRNTLELKPIEGPVTAELAQSSLGEWRPPTDTGQPQSTDAILGVAHTVTTEPGEIPRLKLTVEGKQFDLPLEHTHVDAEITGHVARVQIEQTYHNPFSEPIETIYVFPLPENSAVDDMRMEIGERVVQAEIKKRNEARQVYEAAKSEGFTAALLEQERPNLFTQSVANIAPKSRIKVVIRYVQDMTYDGGQYEWVFPMVVGPRFIPGDMVGKSGTGWAPDTTEVPDASRITPPIVGGGVRSGHDISISVKADTALPLSQLEVPTHEVATEQTNTGFDLMLAEQESLPNRDFVLRYKVDGEQPQAAVQAHRTGEGPGYFQLVLQPPRMDIDAEVGRREFIFVVDVSGSMRGVPLSLCKDAMTQALQTLRPVDTFNIIRFESSNAQLFDAPRPANQDNLKAGMEFVTDLRAGGGTRLGDAVQAALKPAIESGRNRYVFFMTDALIGNETQILESIRTLLQAYNGTETRARVFSFGVSSRPNRYLLENMAKEGQGVAVYAAAREDPSLAVNRFFEIVDKPIIQQLAIDWGTLPVEQTYPALLPDLFASRPVVIHGKYAGPGTETITIKGRTPDGKVIEMPVEVTLPAEEPTDGVLGTLWARAKINDLERDLWGGPDQQVISAITDLGIDHRIVTPYTSFVAVDRSRKVGTSDTTIVQPTEAGENTAEAEEPEPSIPSPAPSKTAEWGEFKSSAPAGDITGGYGLGQVGSGRGGGGGNFGGGMGTMGRGSGGSGYGSVGGLADKSTVKPKLKPGNPDVTGSLDRRIIRKVINQHKNEVKKCYERELMRNPRLAGKVEVNFVIDSKGNISAATVKSSTIGNSKVGDCLTMRIKRWRFPAPKGGGLVKVTYPFVFENGSGVTTTPTGPYVALTLQSVLPETPEISRNIPTYAVESCFTSALERKIEVDNVTAEVAFNVLAGAATEVEIAGVTDPELQTCITQSIQSANYAPSNSVSYDLDIDALSEGYPGNALTELLTAESNDISGCFYRLATARRDQPTAPHFTVSFSIDTAGYAHSASTSATEPSAQEVSACIADRVTHWRFTPATGSDATVTLSYGKVGTPISVKATFNAKKMEP